MSPRNKHEIEEACVVMHDAYEAAAQTHHWATQLASRKPWADVPEANKETMRAAVGALFAHLEQSDLIVSFPFQRPTITTLCGSTWFKDAYAQVNAELTLKGEVVLSCGVFGHADNVQVTPAEAMLLNQLHLMKIQMSDGIYVINVNGYVGETTQKEIAYAQEHSKQVRYLEEEVTHEQGRNDQ